MLPDPLVYHYQSNGLTLKGWIYKPAGAGPFPVIFANHGSEQQPIRDKALAAFWIKQGFIYFKPIRSGHGGNPGPYIGDEIKPILAQINMLRARPGTTSAQLQVLYDEGTALHRKANEDVVAAYRYLLTLPDVDRNRIVVMGGSYGGIQTLLTAEANNTGHLGIRGFVPMSPAAESWGFGRPRPQDPGGNDPEFNTAFAHFLTGVIDDAEGPIYLMQAHNDFSLGPTEVLGAVVDARGAPNRCNVFPTHGDASNHNNGHAGFFADPTAWGPQVWSFLEAIGEVPQSQALLADSFAVVSASASTATQPAHGPGAALESCGRHE